MGWISRFRGSRDTEPAKPWDETVINAPCDPHKVIEGRIKHVVLAGAPQNENIAEQVKRRQVSLAVRYIAVVRVR